MPRKRKVAVVVKENVEPQEKLVTTTRKPDKSEKPSKKQKREPDWAVGDGLNVIKIILSLQKSDCNINKCTTELTKLYKKMDHKTFVTSLLKMTRMFLNRDEGDEIGIRVIKFIGHFVASFGEEVDDDTGESHPMIQDMFKELLTLSSTIVHVRVHLCMLISLIMSSFSSQAEIDENIIEKVTERMLYFIKDISPQVRAQAVLGLQRLQDPDNNEDPVTKAYIYHMESDPAPKVRQAVITAIAKKIVNMPSIIERLHDVDEKVRRHTYLQMASFSVKTYKIADRIAILSTGLNDRSESVKKAVSNILLYNWVGVYDYDYAELIRAVKLDSSEKNLVQFRQLAEQTLEEIFKKRKLSDMIGYLHLTSTAEFKNCVPHEKTTLEMLLVWKSVAKFHQQYVESRNGGTRDQHNDDDDEEDKSNLNDTISQREVLPELSIFCDFMTKFVDEYKFGVEGDKLQKVYFSQCIVLLLEIAQLNDLGDEVGKKRLQDLLRKVLMNFELSEYAIEEISRVIEQIIPEVDSRLEFFNNVINEMVKIGVPSEYSRQTIIEDLINRSDIDRKIKANKIKLRMMDLKEKEGTFVERKQYGECQKVTEELFTLNHEIIELLKPIAELHSVESVQSLMQLDNQSSIVKKITPAEIIKNLKICYYAITSKGVKGITHEVLSIYNEFVRYHLESPDIWIRIWALKTATAYSLLYESISQDVYNTLKSQIFKNAHVLIWECSIECIIDLLLRYSIEKLDTYTREGANLSVSNITQNRSRRGGARTLYTDADGEEDDEMDEFEMIRNLDIMQMLMHILEQDVDKRIYKILIIGICKLVLHGIYCTRDIISKFLLMYFNPATDAQISQILGIFLENIIKRKKQEYLHDALVPTIVTLLEAPHDSPLREVKLETILKYIVGATRPVFCSNGLNLHNTLGMKFLEFMHENLESKDILKVFSKELHELEVSEDPLLKKDMIKQVEFVLKESSAELRTKKYLGDFRDMLNGTYKAPLKFSSTAQTTAITLAEEEEGIENIEEENEEEAASEKPRESIQSLNQSNNQLPESPQVEANTSNVSLTPSKKKLLDISLEKSVFYTPLANRTIQNDTMTEEVEIPCSPQHVEMPATQIVHVDIPATQQQIDLTLVSGSESDDDEVEEISIDESSPSVPVTPVTVKSKKQITKPEDLPQTPQSSLRKKPVNSKRLLELSQSVPTTPSVSSPLRKARKVPSPSITKTPNSSQNKSQLSASSPKVIASTPKTQPRVPMTPRSEGRITRKQAKEVLAQNSTLTRSASKNLNVKPSSSSESEKSSKDAEKKVAAVKVSKLPVKKLATSAPTRAESTINIQATANLMTRPRRAAKPNAESKATTDRPRWK